MLGGDSGTPAYSVESFVKHYSRINVVRYDHTKRVGGIVNGLEDNTRDLIRGNSRDELTYHKYRYGKTLNYSYQTISKAYIIVYERACSKDLAKLRYR